MSRRLISILDATLTMLIVLGVPTGLLIATGSPVPHLHDIAHHVLAVAIVGAWILWLWCVFGVGLNVVRRVRHRDVAITPTMRRLDRLSAALAGLILTIAASLFPGAANATPPATSVARVTAAQSQPSSPLSIPEVSTLGTYRVQAGDCLWTIAVHLYGDGDLWPLLANANLGHVMDDGEVFVNPSLIMPGWELSTPPEAPPETPPQTPPQSAAQASRNSSVALGPQKSLTQVPRRATVEPAANSISAEVRDAAVIIVPGVGAGLLLFALLRRRFRRTTESRHQEIDPFVDVEIAAARLDNVPLATMAEQAVWLADGDGILTRPLIMELGSNGARLFDHGSPCWSVPASELVHQTPFVDHAPSLILPLGDDEEVAWALVVPQGCDAELAGADAGQLLDLSLGLQEELAWGSMILMVESSAALEELSPLCDEGTLFVSREVRSSSSSRSVSHLTTVEQADITVESGIVIIDSLGLQFNTNHVSTAAQQGALDLMALDSDPFEGEPTSFTEHAASQPAQSHSEDRPTDEEFFSDLGQPSEVTVRLLCSEPRIDGGVLPVESKRSRRATELLAYLALHTPDPVTSDRLRSRVLGTSSTDAASKTLFNVASALRRALGTYDGEPVFPRASRTGLYRSGARVVCDISLLEASIAAAESTTDDDTSMALYRDALELIESEPLAAALIGYEWFDAEGHRGRLESCVERAALSLATLALDHSLVPLAEFAMTKARIVVPYSESLAEMAIEVAGALFDPDALRRAFSELVRVIDDLDPGRSPRPAVERRFAELQNTVASRP